MKKDEMKNRINAGFSEMAPDVFCDVMRRLEQEEKTEKASFEKRARGRKWMGALATFAAACLMLLVLAGYRERDVYLVLSVNPQIEIVMDESGCVKRICGLNEEGKEIAEALEKSKNVSVQQAMKCVISAMKAKKYLHDGSGMLFSIYAPKEEQSRSLMSEIEGCVLS